MADHDLIAEHLESLDKRLRALTHRQRRRIVVESRDHLLAAAAAHGSAEAISRFGSPAEVAAAHLTATANHAPTRTVRMFALAGIAYGFVQAAAAPATFGVFPPGPWPNDQPPQYLAWKVDLAGALIGLSILIGLAAVVTLWRTRERPLDERRLPVTLAFIGAAVFASSWPFETLFEFQRASNVAGSPSFWVVGMISATQLACHVIALLATMQAARIVGAALNTRRATV